LPVERREVGNVEVVERVAGFGLRDGFFGARNDLRFVRGGRARRKRQPREVACESDARRNDDVRLRSGAAEPFTQVRNQRVEVHGRLKFQVPAVPSSKLKTTAEPPVDLELGTAGTWN